MLKIAFVGNSRTHKSACFFRTLELLKREDLKVGYCTDLSLSQKERGPAAAAALLFAQLQQESEGMARRDIDYLVTERSVLDWYLYYELACRTTSSGFLPEIPKLVYAWADHYDLIVFMRSLDRPDDGCRPIATSDRDAAEPEYRRLFKWLQDTRGASTVLIMGDTAEERVIGTEIAIKEWLTSHTLRRAQ